MSLLDPKLQAFLAITQVGTVHGAAKVLLITQTGVTQRIRALEMQLRTTLFTRSRTGMKLTSEGEALLRYCQQAGELEGELLGSIEGQSIELKVRVTIAGPTSIMSSRIIPGCSHLYEQFPNLLLDYRLDDLENRLELLKKGVVQLTILSPDEVTLEMDSKFLRPDRYLLVACPLWRKRKLVDIIRGERIIDFYESDQTTFKYLKKFKLLEEATQQRLFANTNTAIIELFKKGIGYGTLTSEIAAPYLDSGELIALNRSQVLEEPQALVWYPRKEMPGYFKAIVDVIG